VACGNIGRPFPAAALELHDALVVEVSSFQLETQSSFHPRVSVLLNLAPDHLDWHGTFEAYAAAKARIFANQGPGDVHVGNRDDEGAAGLSRSARCEIRWFTTAGPSTRRRGSAANG
jgi:UDP-N-acetylmuramoylalanine--D-glutamate ligase